MVVTDVKTAQDITSWTSAGIELMDLGIPSRVAVSIELARSTTIPSSVAANIKLSGDDHPPLGCREHRAARVSIPS